MKLDCNERVLDGYKRAKTLDFSRMTAKLLIDNNDDEAAADAVHESLERYREFLAIVYAYPQLQIVPTKQIDHIWHQHILDTCAYRRDCDFVFGRELDHNPYFGIDGPEDAAQLNEAFDKTCELWELHFEHLPSGAATSNDGSICGGRASICSGRPSMCGGRASMCSC